jgi:hypothetical protein
MRITDEMVNEAVYAYDRSMNARGLDSGDCVDQDSMREALEAALRKDPDSRWAAFSGQELDDLLDGVRTRATIAVPGDPRFARSIALAGEIYSFLRSLSESVDPESENDRLREEMSRLRAIQERANAVRLERFRRDAESSTEPEEESKMEFREASLWVIEGAVAICETTRSDTRVVVVVADGFDEALALGREALLWDWTSLPSRVERVVAVRPANPSDLEKGASVYVPVAR